MEKPRQVGTQLEPGTLLNDRYYIVKRIGGGGMGSVYQARDKRLADRLCAVKEMIEMFADEGQRAKAVEDFTREAQLLASLEHRSIPTIFDYFIEAAEPVFSSKPRNRTIEPPGAAKAFTIGRSTR